MQKKIIINLEGGLITEVFGNDDVEILVIDRDTEGAEEFISLDEINDFKENDKFYPLEVKSGILEEGIPLI